MGKSGHIARKIAATLSSTGTPAYFVHPAEASHGDLGAITRQDVLLMLSWGGETAELGDLISYAKRFRIPLIGIASNPDSTLMQAADVKLLLPRAPEACPNGLAPTTSTTMMLALGDALAVALMERKGFSPDQYRDFHPGGCAGPRPDPGRRPDASRRRNSAGPRRRQHARSAARHGGSAGLAVSAWSMAPARWSALSPMAMCAVTCDGEDFLESRKASDVMTRDPKIAHPGQLAVEALAQMTENKITRFLCWKPATRAKSRSGVLHIHDCLRAGLG